MRSSFKRLDEAIAKVISRWVTRQGTTQDAVSSEGVTGCEARWDGGRDQPWTLPLRSLAHMIHACFCCHRGFSARCAFVGQARDRQVH